MRNVVKAHLVQGHRDGGKLHVAIQQLSELRPSMIAWIWSLLSTSDTNSLPRPDFTHTSIKCAFILCIPTSWGSTVAALSCHICRPTNSQNNYRGRQWLSQRRGKPPKPPFNRQQNIFCMRTRRMLSSMKYWEFFHLFLLIVPFHRMPFFPQFKC